VGDAVSDSVIIVIPSIPGRAKMLARAVQSVAEQSYPCQVVVEIDHERRGAWWTRNRGIERALDESPDWIGFLDDDDYLLHHHVEFLLACADGHDADVVWPWFEVNGGTDPFPQHRGRQYDPEQPHIFPITYLARGEAVRAAMDDGGFRPDPGIGSWESQDYPFVTALWHATGGRFHGTVERTWVWSHHGGNTSGLPNR